MSEADEWFSDAEAEINKYILAQQKLTQRPTKPEPSPTTGNSANNGGKQTSIPMDPSGTKTVTPTATQTPTSTLVNAKPTQAINAKAVYKEVSDSMYMETVEDVDNYVKALREKLVSLVESHHKVRIQ